MKNYIVYEKETGRIIRSGFCSDMDFDLQAQENESLLEGIVSVQGYIDNGNFVPFPKKPFSFYLFDYTTKQWYDPRTKETQWGVVREQRNNLLASSDWTQLLDIYIPNKSAWAAYRQQLRDVTTQSDPFNIIWPTPPQG